MCRVAFWNRAMMARFTPTILEEYLATLERLQGGDGNGVAIRTQHNEIVGRKGVNLTIHDAAQFLLDGYASGAKEFLFHTRLISAGGKCDANCHPFTTAHSALAHNGHDWHAARLAWGNDSDTAFIARGMFTGLIKVPVLDEFSGTFMGWYRGRPFVVSNGSTPCQVLRHEASGAWLTASLIPKHFVFDGDTFDDSDGYYFFGHWVELASGWTYMPPRAKKVRTYHPAYKPYAPSAKTFDGWWAGDDEPAKSATPTLTKKQRKALKALKASATRIIHQPDGYVHYYDTAGNLLLAEYDPNYLCDDDEDDKDVTFALVNAAAAAEDNYSAYEED